MYSTVFVRFDHMPYLLGLSDPRRSSSRSKTSTFPNQSHAAKSAGSCTTCKAQSPDCWDFLLEALPFFQTLKVKREGFVLLYTLNAHVHARRKWTESSLLSNQLCRSLTDFDPELRVQAEKDRRYITHYDSGIGDGNHTFE